MTTQLALYNKVMVLLGERQLASLSEAREPRRVLDTIYAEETAYCLERKFWNFGYRAVQIDANSSITPHFGFNFAFQIPADWIRTRRISGYPQLNPPLEQFAEEAGWWFANLTPLYVQYNSNDPGYGMNLAAWPASFADYVAHRLAEQSAARIPGKMELLAGETGLTKRTERAYKIANANCAMNEAVGFAPVSSWVRARRWPGPGQDNPTGPTLTP